MSIKKSCPTYPTKCFIISGHPSTTELVSGCSRLSAAEVSSSGACVSSRVFETRMGSKSVENSTSEAAETVYIVPTTRQGEHTGRDSMSAKASILGDTLLVL